MRISGWLPFLRRSPIREVVLVGLLSILTLLIFEMIGVKIPSGKKVPEDFSESFADSGTIYETADIGQSTSSYWWVNSGAELVVSSGTASTVAGALPADNHWRELYAATNPQDTDDGYHPQNIFRLVTKQQWQDMTEQVYFKIDATNLSTSSNRNESNGLLLFSRYKDGDNLYYVGIRVDGAAVIKKKINGTYYTMTYNPIFPGRYDPIRSPNLLPQNTWIGLREIITNSGPGAVRIQVYVDVGRTGNWLLVAEAEDDGKSFGGPAFLGAGYGGIRTDFMDVEFDGFNVTPAPDN